VDLQGFVVGRRFVVKEVAGTEKRSYSFSLHFYISHAMKWHGIS